MFRRISQWIVLMAVLFLIPAVLPAAPIGKISHLEGGADITRADGKTVPLRLSDPVNMGDVLRTKGGAKVEVTFTDGNTLWLAEKTRLKVTRYQNTEGQRSFFDLFRGKTRTVVNKLARKSSLEIQTPTAVCGVRGTIIIGYFLNGLSGFAFERGQGYGYNRRMPGQIVTFGKGEVMQVPSATAPPVVRQATGNEIDQHVKETSQTPGQEKAGEGGGSSDEGKGGGQGQGQDQGQGQGQGQGQEKEKGKDQEQGQDQGQGQGQGQDQGQGQGQGQGQEQAPGQPAGQTPPTQQTPGTATDQGQTTGSQTSPPPADTTTPQSLITGELSGALGSTTLLTSPTVSTTTIQETTTKDLPPPPPPPPTPTPTPTPTETTTRLNQAVTQGTISGNLTGSISDTTNTGTLSLTGMGMESIYVVPTTGTLSDGSTDNAYLTGIPGSWRGLFIGLSQKGTDVSLLKGDLSGAYAADQSLSASGSIARASGYGISAESPYQAFADLPLLVLQNVSIGQAFSDPVIYGPTSGDVTTDGVMGYNTSAGGILGIWGAQTLNGFYVNATGETGRTINLYHYNYYPESQDPSDHFAFGNAAITDDLQGHTTVQGSALTYLDRHSLGTLSLDYRGVYDFSPETSPIPGPSYRYSSIGTGTYDLQPLAWSGDWGPNRGWWDYGVGSLFQNAYYPEDGYSSMEWVAHDMGLVGGTTRFWTGTSHLTALGYVVDDDGYPVTGETIAGPLLWNSGIGAQALTGSTVEEVFTPDAEFTGVTAGVWKDGRMNGSTYAIYKTAAGQAGWLIGKDTLSGLYDSEIGIWKAEGDLTPTERIAQLPAGVTSADLEVFHDIGIGILGGSFTGDQGKINNYESIMQTTFYGKRLYDDEGYLEKIIPLRWGIYDLRMAYENSFSGKPSGAASWTSKIGGYGPTQMNAPFFYLADISGNWLENGTIDGQLSGTYMTPLYLGVLSGPVYGLYTEEVTGSGGWIGQSIGTYNVTQKLAHSATWGENLYVWYDGEGGLFTDAGGWIDHTGYVMGLLGGTTAPWSGSSAPKAMGLFQVYAENNAGRGTYLWSGAIQGSVPGEFTETPSAGGIYTGYSAALWRKDSYAGAIRTIYLTPPDAQTGKSSAGFLAGDNMAGTIYNLVQDTYEGVDYVETYTVGAWESTGENSLTASVPLASGLDPSAVTLAGGTMDARLSGTFGGSGTLTNDTAWGDLTFFMNGAEPLPFGVYDLKLGSGDPGGTFSGKPDGTTSWDAKLGGSLNIGGGPALAVSGGYNDEYGYWLADVGGQWNASGEITGNVTNGKYLTTTQMGTLSGPFYGLYTEGETAGAGTWVGQSIGNYQGESLQYASQTVSAQITSTNRRYFGEYTYPEASSSYSYTYYSDNTGSMTYYRNLGGGDYYTITYNADGTYTKTDYTSGQTTTGTWQDTQHQTLAFLQTPPDIGSATLWDKGDRVNPIYNGLISQALLGGTQSIWGATSTSPAQATMMGQYIPGTSAPGLWNTTAYSYNYKKDTNTTYDGGAYTGWLSGTTLGHLGNANFLGLYINPTGDAGVVRGSLEGPFYPQTGMLVMDGGLYPEEPVVTGIGIAPENLLASTAQTWDYSGMNFAATLGTGGSIWTDNQSLDTMFIVKEGQGQPWGIYRQGFAGRFNPDESGQTTWYGQAGGVGTFGYYNHAINGATGDTGYWLADASGNWWGDGSVDGALNNGWFITATKSGNLSGNFLGVYETRGNTWQATGLGTWEGAPLAYSAKVYSGSWGYYDTTPGSEGLVNNGHPIAGLMGGISPLFGESNADVMGLGTYTRNQNSPLFNMLLTNSDGSPETNPFHVYYGGSWFPAGKDYPEWFEGKMMGFYGRNWDGNQYNEIGLITSGPLIDESGGDSGFSVWADLYPNVGMWKIPADEYQGTLTYDAKPGTAASFSIAESDWSPAAKVGGDLQGTMRTKSAHIDGIEGWGIWMSAMGGPSPETIPERWASQTGWREDNAYGKPSYSIADVDGYYYDSDGGLWGGVSGRFLNPDNMGVFTGDMVGIAGDGNWQALGIGSFEVTSTLSMAASIGRDGTGRIIKGIPGEFKGAEYASVGRYTETEWQKYNGSFQWEGGSDKFLMPKYMASYFDDGLRTDRGFGREEFDTVTENTWTDQGSVRHTNVNLHTTDYLYTPANFFAWTDPHDFMSTGSQPTNVAWPNFDLGAPWDESGWTGTHPHTPFATLADANDFGARSLYGQYWENYVPARSWSVASNSVEFVGSFEGLMGITGDLWSGPATITLMGRYAHAEGYQDGDFKGSLIFNAPVNSNDYYTPGQGAFAGFLSGVLPDTGSAATMKGLFYGLYINADATEWGVVQGALADARAYPNIEMWESAGTLAREREFSTTQYPLPDGVTAATLADNLFSGEIMIDRSSGFGSPASVFAWGGGYGRTLSIAGKPGVGTFFLTHGYGNFYSGDPLTDSPKWGSTGWAEFGRNANQYKDYGLWIIGTPAGTRTWADGQLSADLSGFFLTHTKYGSMTGRMVGTYDTADSSWQATSQGYWQAGGAVRFSSQFGADKLQSALAEKGEGAAGASTYRYSIGLGDDARYGEAVYHSDARDNYTRMEWLPSVGIGFAERWTYDRGTDRYQLASETYTSIEAFRTDLAELSTSPDATITLSKTQGYLEDDREGLTGILAGLDGNLWTSGSRLHFLLNSGDLAQYLPLRTVASQEIASFNPAVNTDPWQNSAMPSAIGGAYRGFLGGAVKGDQTGGGLVETFQGMFSALYYNSNNNDIGILYAPLTGDVYQSLGAIVSKDPANNLLIPYKLGTAALDPETFVSQSVSYSGLDDKLFWNTDGTGGLPGQHVLIGGAGSDAWIRLQSIKQASMSIMYTDQTGTHSVPWSIWQYTMTGLYGQSSAGKYPEDWRWTTSSFADGAQESRIILSGQPIANGYVEGVALQSNAVWTPPDNRPVPYTSLAGGEIKGLFDPGKATWQMIAQGAGMETSAFLAHVNALQSDEARQAFYRATKIPCFEVGRTDLKAASVVQGSNGTIDMTGVHGMKDVTFFAPTSGATLPQIWGTNAVSGGYTGNPQGIPVPLSNTGNTVSAMFNMQSWNTGTQNWGATVTGGQAAVDALKPGSDAFGFSGGAAGKIDQPQSGVFTGTAAGIVH